MLTNIVREGDIAVAHSNGCTILNRACWDKAQLRRVTYINPALDEDMPLSSTVNTCQVWHSPGDKPVKWAAFLPGHPWGRMGATGYKGSDRRYTNHNKQRDFGRISKSHSDIFSPPNIAYFGPLIFKQIVKRKIP
jgi:hypothetical protein